MSWQGLEDVAASLQVISAAITHRSFYKYDAHVPCRLCLRVPLWINPRLNAMVVIGLKRLNRGHQHRSMQLTDGTYYCGITAGTRLHKPEYISHYNLRK